MEEYRHLSLDERNIIANLVKLHNITIENGHLRAPKGAMAYIANVLGRSRQTILRELHKNWTPDGYLPHIAHQRALQRRKSKATPRIGSEVWDLVRHYLELKRSPETISVMLYQEKGIRISHERIYQYVYDNRLGRLLPTRRKRRRHRGYKAREGRGKLKNQTPITERPAEVEERSSPGHWEVDTMELAKGDGVLVVAVERHSRLVVAEQLQSKHAQLVARAVKRLLKEVGKVHPVRTVTSDNGKEWARHEGVSQGLKAKWYFAHPGAAWERGSVENAIKLLRRWYPKGMRRSEALKVNIKEVLFELNRRPRRILNWRNPLEVYGSLA